MKDEGRPFLGLHPYMHVRNRTGQKQPEAWQDSSGAGPNEMQWEATGSRADIKWNTKSCLVLSTELNKQKSCTQTSLSILSVYPRSALLCFTCINRLLKLFEDKHHISVYQCTNKKLTNYKQDSYRQCIEDDHGCFLLKAAEQEPVNSSSCRITKPLYNNIYTDLHKKT